jgi:hypothetical protein
VNAFDGGLEGVRSRCGSLNGMGSKALGAEDPAMMRGSQSLSRCGVCLVENRTLMDRLSGVCHLDVVVIWVRWVRGRGSREIRPT